jgi:hypothetical protein
MKTIEFLALVFVFYIPLRLIATLWGYISPNYWMNSSPEILYQRDIELRNLEYFSLGDLSDLGERLDGFNTSLTRLFLLDLRILLGV